MFLHSLFRYFVYLFCCYSAVRGAAPVSRPSEHVLTSSRSSPYSNYTNKQIYSEWSGWSSCSSTCGLGIITRTRTCLKRTFSYRGIYVPQCHAEYSEHRICNLKHCPPDAPDVRRSQCSRHNNRTVAGKLVKEWVPVEAANPCELRCKSTSGDTTLGFGKVTSGTPCDQGVCVDGRCLKVGCDGLLGSRVSEDACGVCGGQNTSCVHYKDLFQGQPTADQARRNGYHEIVVLPIGARNLMIRQLVGKNYLALQDRTRGIIFNGEQHLTKNGGHFDIAGTNVKFQKSDNVTEILTAKGPITQELYVLVLLRYFNRGIYYEYWLPRQSYPSNKNQPLSRPESPARTTMYTTLKPTQYVPTVHKPTKPAYAYGYGEKPYRSKEAPVFRHSTSNPNEYQKNSDTGSHSLVMNPLYKPQVYHPEPSAGYYQTYRNASSTKDAKKKQDLDKELPVLTQPDASGSNGRKRYNNDISNTVLDEKKYHLSFAKSQKSTFGITKRGGIEDRDFVTNGRLKYSLENKDSQEVYLNSSARHTPAPISIALLPDSNSSSRDKIKGGSRRRKKTRLSGRGSCAPCERIRDQAKHFCESDFVIRSVVIGYEFLDGETRYDLEVVQTFHNTLSLLPREFVWSPGTTCRCPRMRPGKEYLVMGRIDNSYRKRESRLLVDRTCFVRTFNLKYARRLQKLKKDRTKRCLKIS